MKETIAIIKLIARNIERKRLPLAAAGLAYYFLMSLFPALVALAAVIAYLPLQDGTQGAASFMGYVMPRQVWSMMERLLTTISPHRTGLLSLGVITALWLASKGFKGIILGLEMVYDAHAPRALWITRILAFGLTLAVGLLLLLGAGLTLAGPVLETLLSRVAPVQSLWVRFWPYVQWSLAVLVTFAAMELLYLVAPNVPAANRLTIPGALVAAASWIALAWGFSHYLHYFGELKLDLLYGVLATPVAFMIWLYWGAAAILFGAEINASLQAYGSLGRAGSRKVSQRGTDAGQKKAA